MELITHKCIENRTDQVIRQLLFAIGCVNISIVQYIASISAIQLDNSNLLHIDKINTYVCIQNRVVMPITLVFVRLFKELV